jgi:hypothetical protein
VKVSRIEVILLVTDRPDSVELPAIGSLLAFFRRANLRPRIGDQLRT